MNFDESGTRRQILEKLGPRIDREVGTGKTTIRTHCCTGMFLAGLPYKVAQGLECSKPFQRQMRNLYAVTLFWADPEVDEVQISWKHVSQRKAQIRACSLHGFIQGWLARSNAVVFTSRMP